MSDSEYAILARFEATPEAADEVAQFLSEARSTAAAEPGMTSWFAVRFSETEFGIFDTFPDEDGREAHLEGGSRRRSVNTPTSGSSTSRTSTPTSTSSRRCTPTTDSVAPAAVRT